MKTPRRETRHTGASPRSQAKNGYGFSSVVGLKYLVRPSHRILSQPEWTGFIPVSERGYRPHSLEDKGVPLLAK